MRKIYEVKARPWIGSALVTCYVCAKCPDDAKKAVKTMPELSNFLYNDTGFSVKPVNARTEGWRDNEIRGENYGYGR